MPLAFRGSVLEDDLAKALEALLQRARSGDISGIAYTITTASGFENGYGGAVLDDPMQALAQLSVMHHELAENIRRHLRVVK